MNWYLDVLKNKYAQFEGRAHREEFWMFVLINFLINVGIGIVGAILHLQVLQYLYSLAVFVPTIALGARRLHDTGKSGWWQLIGLIPVLGWIVLIIFYVQDSDPASNQYGANPKGTPPPATA